MDAAREQQATVVLLDTAGRLHVDEPLMQELAAIKAAVNPQEILFVADAMTGQDAVTVAESFNERLGLTGVVLTKMDGDARGGAALSIWAVTGAPRKRIWAKSCPRWRSSILTASRAASWVWATCSPWWKRPRPPSTPTRPKPCQKDAQGQL